jgi:hypothetical protein
MLFAKHHPMKYLPILLLLVISQVAFSQAKTCDNIFIITTDGFRWQELFNGADSALLFDPARVKDTSLMKYMYWADSPEERRKKLMPFLWNYIVQKGQLWGNRSYNNDVSVVNPYRISYPGYNEILTGYNDWLVPFNQQKDNDNSNVLEYLNSTPEFKNKVAAFGSWKMFDYILNRPTSTIKLNCGYQPEEDDTLTNLEQATNYVQAVSPDNTNATRVDMLTYTLATEYVRKKHPRVVFIGFGQTDEYAHEGKYDQYLDQANMFDKFLAQLWTLIQSDDFYKGKTTIFITTDHGRGMNPGTFATHGFWAKGSKETWVVQMGPNIKPLGEMKDKAEINNIQFAQTIAGYLGKYFVTDHSVAAASLALSQH